MNSIPVSMPQDLIEKLDALVKLGKFRNRSEAIRKIVRERIENENLDILINKERNERIRNAVRLMLSQPKPVLTFLSEKTAEEIVAEGRSR